MATASNVVQRAKRLQYAIEASLAVVQLHDNFSDEESEEGDPDHDTDEEAASSVLYTRRSVDPTTSNAASWSRALRASGTFCFAWKSSAASAAVSLSQTARPRIKLDRIIDTVNNGILASHNASDPSQSMLAMMMAMEERQQARDAQYRHERELYQRQRDEHEAVNQQMMMMLLVRLVESGGGAASSGEQHGNGTDAGLENKLE
ncbi:hypothetical protein PHYSODRAFT_320476 [Phytophthora sojae]|uniref:Uncharacterized protein n=1 Tax=Phytophthora sojae (strain P6497) TaxID=1094619 RepID=G4YGL8_PHYSP|nr:hypothetical protein PHYSODRAFT_320476 [Phytophthora sojae]EGZ26552.1 hypothetical protein PHYSODRAFT_320476 [Phytophthora sojae]|eukprot:XP_009513827.1 hypothetical protein PHYSODRAFT_320476 [Phytophthora sojae]